MKKSKPDHSTFYKNYASSIIILVVYMVDFFFFSWLIMWLILSLLQVIAWALLPQSLTSIASFKHKIWGLKHFLGIKVMGSKTGIGLPKRTYVFDLSIENGKRNKPMYCCSAPNLQLTNYLIVIHLNINYSISVINQFHILSICSPWGCFGTYHMLLKRGPLYRV